MLLRGKNGGTGMMNIVQFRQYCNQNFQMNQWGERIQDVRKRPQITNQQAFESVCQMAVLGQKSLLEADEFSRTLEARKWHGILIKPQNYAFSR
jgi:hypothetical protein